MTTSDAGAATVEVYWRPGCPFCSSLRDDLSRRGIPAVWRNIWEDDAARAFVRDANGGDETVPTVRVGPVTVTNPAGGQVADLVAALGGPAGSGRAGAEDGASAGPVVTAVWRGVVLAESRDTVVVDGHHYFPPEAVHRHHLLPSSHTTTCSWKGRASYFHIRVGEATNTDAAWCYADPDPAAAAVRGRIAFWHGVTVTVAGTGSGSAAGAVRSLLTRLTTAFRP